MNEKRKFLRASIALSVRVKDADGTDIDAFTGSLSAGGVFLETFKPLPVDHELTIEMHLPGLEEKTLLSGKVVWNRAVYLDEYPPGMGVKFINIVRKDQVRINNIVQKILEGREEDF
ncbi:MAG: PilZ domain-containing protein [Nitrospirae bacterium]|nr:PilZ domain-containing protein [Nitrospirota bacterium]